MGISNFAQAQFRFGGSLIASLPIGSLADFTTIGLGLQAEGLYDLNDNMSIGVSAGYTYLVEKNEFDGITYSIVPITAYFNYHLKDTQSGLYFSGGLGAYTVTASFDSFGFASISSTEIGLNLGAGVLLGKLNLTGKLHLIEDTTYFGIGLGLLFGGE
ncbi:MAG: hypothetical protein OHK0053_08540 [Microscillaceae bacterium]